jgi:Flp pilus assembly protein CpaB
MPRNPLIYAAGGFMVLAVVVSFVLLPRGKPVEPAAPPEVKQVLAAVEIPPRTRITEGMLRLATTKNPEPNTATDIGEVVGRITLKSIGVDQPIVRNVLSAREGSVKEPLYTFAIPGAKRAIGLTFDPRSVARVATVGDRVDIVVVYKEGFNAIARTIAQNCEVLATEETFTPAPQPVNQPGSNQPPPPPNGQPPPQEKKEVLVVVATTPLEAQRIVAAGERGSLKIIMRDPRNGFAERLPESWEHPKGGVSAESVKTVRSKGNTAAPQTAYVQSPITRPVFPPTNYNPFLSPAQPVVPKPKTVQIIRGTNVQSVQIQGAGGY